MFCLGMKNEEGNVEIWKWRPEFPPLEELSREGLEGSSSKNKEKVIPIMPSRLLGKKPARGSLVVRILVLGGIPPP